MPRWPQMNTGRVTAGAAARDGPWPGAPTICATRRVSRWLNAGCLGPLVNWMRQHLAEPLGERCCHGWGIREAGRLVACVRAHVSDSAAEPVRLVVAPGRQGLGIGTRLLLATEDLLPPQVRTIGLFTG